MFYYIAQNSKEAFVYDSADCTYGVVSYKLIIDVCKSDMSLFRGIVTTEHSIDVKNDYIYEMLVHTDGIIVIRKGVCALIKDNSIKYWVNGFEYELYRDLFDYNIYMKGCDIPIYKPIFKLKKYYFLPLRDGILVVGFANTVHYIRLVGVSGVPCQRGEFLRRVIVFGEDYVNLE